MYVHKKSLKLAFKTGFSIHNNHLNLCGQVEHSKWMFCIQNTAVKCGF